jgi:N-acetyl-anhydromuramyl-L-alanine amidase AmpD
MTPKYIIIHAMGETIIEGAKEYTAVEWLHHLRLSAHELIYPNGVSYQMRDWNVRAAHAGVSKWGDDVGLNSCSLGFELLIEGAHNYGLLLQKMATEGIYTDLQYDKLAQLCADACIKFDLHPNHSILTHEMVAGDNVRGKGKGKRDPGRAFDIKRLIGMTNLKMLPYI